MVCVLVVALSLIDEQEASDGSDQEAAPSEGSDKEAIADASEESEDEVEPVSEEGGLRKRRRSAAVRRKSQGQSQ